MKAVRPPRPPLDRVRPPRRVACALALALAMTAVPCAAQTVRSDLHMTNGTINAEVLSGGTLYIGGSFTNVGPATGSGVPVDTSSGQIVPGFPKVVGTVKAVLADGSGGWFVGGAFSSVGGQPRANLAHVLPDLSVDAFDPEPDQQVLALALAGGSLIAGGDFANIGGAARSRIAALDPGSGLAGSWNPGANATVRALAVTDSVIYVGGDFTSIGGKSRNRIAALDPASGSASPWNPGSNGSVFALDVLAGSVYAGGFFSVIGGASRVDLAAIRVTTGSAKSWNPHPDSQVFTLVASGSRIYIGGQFSQAGGAARSRIAAIDTATATAVASWNPGANGNVFALALGAGALYAGGDFLNTGGQPRTRIAALDVVTGLATSFNPSAYGTVSALAVSGASLYVGGSFAAIGGVARNNLAAIDVASGAVTAWNPSVDGSVLALAHAANGDVIVGGLFANAGGAGRANVARVDSATALATTWDPEADGQVSALATQGSLIYAGGLFGTIGGASRSNVAALDAATGLATSWNPGVNGQVFVLLADAATVTVGGSFTSAGGQSRSMIAAISASTGLALPWNPNSNGTVRAMIPACGLIYVGGFFTTIGGAGRNRIAVLDASTGAATAWNANANGQVFALALGNGALYASGLFSTIGGQSRSRIASLNPATGAATTWNPGTDNVARAFALGGGELYAGGSFGTMGGQPAANLAGISEDATLFCPAITVSPALLPEGRVGTGFAQTLSASGGTGPYCLAITNGTIPPGLSFDSSSGALSGTPALAGTFAFTVTASTSIGCAGSRDYSLLVRPACPSITVLPAALPLGHVGAAYAETLTTSAGTPPYSWSIASGALPDGLSLSADGVISGIPTTIGAASFNVSLIDANLCTSGGSLSLSIFPACGTVAIAPPQIPDGVVGVAYDQLLSAGGGRIPYAWSIASGVLPGGLVLDPASGHLHGVPTTAGTSTFLAAATDSVGCVGTRGYTLSFFSEPPASSVAANTSGLLISNGSPCVSVPIVFTRGESAPALGASVTIQIDPAKLALCRPDTVAANFHLGSWFDGMPNGQLFVTANGGGSYTVDAALLGAPCGITGGGTLFTVDLAAVGSDGTGTITVVVAHARDCSNAAIPVGQGAPASLEINTQALTIRPAAIADAVLGEAYAVTFTTDAGTAPFIWSLVSGSLPGGLTLDGPTGTLSGTPAATGTYYFRVQGVDVNGRTGSRAYTLTVFASEPVSSLAATAPQCITPAHPQVAAQLVLTRGEATPARAVSVTFQLDPAKLALATPATPASSIHPGDWLTGFSNTSFLVTANGAGSYTVDVALLGSPCGITTGGTLASLDLVASDGTGAGAIHVLAVHARDCSNVPIPVGIGADGLVTIDAGPGSVHDLLAYQMTIGAPISDTTAIRLTWSGGPATQTDLYRAPFGTYPLYADAGAPPDSTTVPGAPWVHLASNPASGYLDHPSARGVWCYILQFSDSCGATSLSNRTPGTLDYFLGDVSDGFVAGHGNNRVLSEDLSLLGAHYGISGAAQVNPVGFLDVGPTANGTPGSRPLPDHQIDFEDLLIFAQSYGVQGPPPPPPVMAAALAPPAGGPDRFDLVAPSLVEPGDEVEAVLHVAATGRLRGFSARLAWDPNVVTPVRTEVTGWIAAQGGIALPPSPGALDAALLGALAAGLTGEGDVATFHFRVLRAGLPAISLASVDGRDLGNRRVTDLATSTRSLVPGETILLAPAPNPARGRVQANYALARADAIELAVYGVDGRRVRTLRAGREEAGVHRVDWDGRDAAGHPTAAGVYYLRLTAGPRSFTRALVFLR